MKDFGMLNHVVPLIAPAQITSTTTSGHVAMKKYEKVKFILALGDLGTDSFVLTVTASAATAGSSGTALAFKYRATAAAGTDTLGDLTDVESTGLTLTHTAFDNKVLIIEVEGIELTDDKPYVGIVLTDPGSATAYVSLVAELKPRYPQETNDGALT